MTKRVVIDENRFLVIIDGKPVRLPPIKFHIVKYLAENPGFIRSRYQIIDNAWEGGLHSNEIDERAVDSHMKHLRKVFDKAGLQLIETRHGFGYAFREGLV